MWNAKDRRNKNRTNPCYYNELENQIQGDIGEAINYHMRTTENGIVGARLLSKLELLAEGEADQKMKLKPPLKEREAGNRTPLAPPGVWRVR